MRRIGSKSLQTSVVLAAAAAIVSLGVAPTLAQQSESAPPHVLQVVEIDVKPGLRAMWHETSKTIMLPANKRAGRHRSVWRIRFSEAGMDYALVSPVESLDQPLKLTEKERKAFLQMQREAVEDARSYVIRFHPELSLGGRGTPDPLINVSFVTVAPGKRAEFRKNLKETALPQFKESGVTQLHTWEILYGGPSNEWMIVTPLKSLGDLANGLPFYRGMSEDEIDQAYAGRAGIVTSIRRAVAEYVPDLSFTASAESSGSE